MRNPNRTTKRERAAARRSCPTICRMIGVNAAARLRRQGLSDDATAFDRMLLALDLPPEVMGDATGSHWSDYQNYAKTEDGRIVYIDPAAYARGAQDLMDALKPHLNTMLHAELTTVTGLDGTNYTVSYDRIDLAAAPVGAPPFNTELFETYRREFDAATMQYTGLDNDGNPTGPTRQVNWPVAITVEHLEENQAKWAELAAAVMRGMGELRVPKSLTIDLDPDAQAELRTAITDACADDASCIVCGGPSEPNSTVCSAGCGYELTGEYPDLYEKDYGTDEDVNPDV